MIPKYGAIGDKVLKGGERFWDDPGIVAETHELLRFSFFLGLFPFAGYSFYYTVLGRVWNNWPFVNTTLPVLRGLMCAGLQWVFFATFPTISTLILDFLFHKSRPADPRRLTVVCTYAMVPMHLAALFVGVLFLNSSMTLLGFSAFVYLLFFGYRRYLNLGIASSVFLTLLVLVLFALIRQMFVFVIGF